jgi:glycosyltransferase involved in cell wall biosynthesis
LVRDRPDVVHFLCNTATIGIRAPYVVTLHDRIQLSPQPLPVGQGTQAYRRWAMTVYSRRTIGAVLAGAARIIAVSRYERDALARECGVAGDRIVVTHEAAHSGFRRLTGPERVQAEHDLRVRLGIRRPFLVTVGYEPRKQIPTAIHALAALGPEDADLELVIVAAAPDRQGVFQTLAASLGVDRRTRVLGRLGTDDVARLYNLADAFVFPSEREGFGLPPLEAMACGAPIIARRATSIPEVVGNAAVLIDSDDPAEWGRAIAHLRASIDLQRGLRSRGLQRAASFSWRRCAEQTLAVYRQAAEDSRRTGPAERR